MLGKLILVGAAFGAVATSFLACGSSTDTTSGGGKTGTAGTAGTGGSATGPGSGGGGTHAEPPPPPAKTPGDGSAGTVFAIKKLFLGETDRDGTPDTVNGWKQYGYDLDGIITNCSGNTCEQVKGQCTPNSGGQPANIYPDGNNGIDNSFGLNILQTIIGFEPTPSATVDNEIAMGKFTIMIDVTGLGSGDTYNPLLSKLYGGADLMHAPKWDGTDMWPLIPELLTPSGDSKVQFPNSYVTKNTWVSGGAGTVSLNISISSVNLQLDIGHAILSFDMAPDHKSATNGTVAGVLNTEQLVSELQKVAGNLSTMLCSGQTAQSIFDEIRQASDIMTDGSAGAGKECDGISIGLGFDADIVQLGPKAPPSMGTGNPCADAGMGGGSAQ